MDIKEKKIVYYTGNTILFILKYFCLILFVLTAGMTVGLTVYGIANGEDIPNTLIANMIELITKSNVNEVLEAILKFGKIDTIVTAVGIGFADSITYFLLYIVLGGFKKLYKSLLMDEIYTDENVRLLKELVPLSAIMLFTQPLVMTIIRDIAKTNDNLGGFNFIGIPFVIISLILYAVISKGVLIENKLEACEKKLTKLEEEQKEADIIALEKKVRERKEAQAKKKAAKKAKKEEIVFVIKNPEVKKETKKVTKKKTIKAEVKPVVKKFEKKTSAKKEVKATTKKTATVKKPTVKKVEIKKTVAKPVVKKTEKKVVTKKAEPKTTVKKTTSKKSTTKTTRKNSK